MTVLSLISSSIFCEDDTIFREEDEFGEEIISDGKSIVMTETSRGEDKNAILGPKDEDIAIGLDVMMIERMMILCILENICVLFFL